MKINYFVQCDDIDSKYHVIMRITSIKSEREITNDLRIATYNDVDTAVAKGVHLNKATDPLRIALPMQVEKVS